MRELVFLLVYTTSLVLTDPIQKTKTKTSQSREYKKPPIILPIPQRPNPEEYALGHTKLPGNRKSQGDRKRDKMCESDANDACRMRCLSLNENCLCATNQKTYRNQCEMSCMRKIDLKKINWEHYGNCETACPAERLERYRSMVRDLLVTQYLKENVKRCLRLGNCIQGKRVLQFTLGNDPISECPQHLPAYYLFATLSCPQILMEYFNKIYNNESVISCQKASIVNKRLFNDNNCATDTHGPTDRELVMWSFDFLDKNQNRLLDIDELNILTKVPDAECGASFYSQCDNDNDGYIREDEWGRCLVGCSDCYRPCYVFQAKKHAQDRRRRYVTSLISCNLQGYCTPKQCETHLARHKQCWCVDEYCNEIKGTRSYATTVCNV